VLCAVALSAAAVLLVVAVAVFRVEGDVRAEDARLSRPELLAGTELGSSGLLAGVASSMLGVGDDRELRRAFVLYRSSLAPDLGASDALALRGEAEVILIRLSRGDSDAVLRGRAANLLGALLVEDARLDPTSTRRYHDQSLGALQDAVRFDPDYEEAKRNLELVATVPPGTLFRSQRETGTAAAATPPQEPGY
jgi:hypothetical protein